MEELSKIIDASQTGDPQVIKAAVVAAGVASLLMVGKMAVSLALKALKKLAQKTATKIDDEAVEAIEQEVKKK